jgi:hypothetical protein
VFHTVECACPGKHGVDDFLDPRQDRCWTGLGQLDDTPPRSTTEPEAAAVDVATWLRNVDLERYEAAFRENGVRPEVLCHLTADDLKELRVAAALSLSANQSWR